MESVGDGFTWRRQSSSVDIDEIDDQKRERITAGAQHLRSDVFVKVSDAHLEDKACHLLFDVLSYILYSYVIFHYIFVYFYLFSCIFISV